MNIEKLNIKFNRNSDEFFNDNSDAESSADEESSSSAAKQQNQNQMMGKDYYIDSYAHYGTHEEKLKDEVRTVKYRNAIYHNRHLFRNKVVMNVGSGTGILSMFAAKAGAKKVFAVEFSIMAFVSRLIVKDNNLDGIITVIRSKIEEIELPDGYEKVDLILFEWMDNWLLNESMLNTVIYARDKWLASDGVLFPDKATLFLCAIEDRQYNEEEKNWWENVYGFNMFRFPQIATIQPLVDVVDRGQVVTNNVAIKELDLYMVKVSDLTFESPFVLRLVRNDYVHAFATFFTVEFTKCRKRIGFSTAPGQRYTHWKQMVFYLRDKNRNSLAVNRGELIEGTFYVGPNVHNSRNLDFDIDFNFAGEVFKLRTNAYVMH